MVFMDKEGLKILKKMILVNSFFKYVHSLICVYLTVVVKATREVSIHFVSATGNSVTDYFALSRSVAHFAQ